MRKILIIGLIPAITYGAPNITSVLGATKNGSVITITGSGFGTKANAVPITSSYDNPTKAYNWSTGVKHKNWSPIPGQEDPILVTTNPRTPWSQSSYKISYDAAGEYSVVGWDHPHRHNKMYVSWWSYWDYPAIKGVSGSGDNCKYMRLYTSTNSHYRGEGLILSQQTFGAKDDGAPTEPLGDYKYTYAAPEHAPDSPSWKLEYTAVGATVSAKLMFKTAFDESADMQHWNHYELYNTYSLNYESGEDSSILIKNGQTIYRATGISLTKADSNNDIRDLRLGQPSGDRTESQMEYLDQVYYDGTFQHVFISDASTLSFPDIATKNIQEVQVPTAWSDTKITIKVNQASISNGKAYLYVMDADGVINTNGYAITLGSKGTQEPTLNTKADVDANSNINLKDVLLVLRNSLGLDMSTTTWKASATGDVNCNGVSNSTDALLILRDFLGLDMSGTGWCVK